MQKLSNLANSCIRPLLILCCGSLIGCVESTENSMTREAIVQVCKDERNKAISPEADINVSRSKKGTDVGFTLSFSSNFLMGSDPEEVYLKCVQRLSKPRLLSPS